MERAEQRAFTPGEASTYSVALVKETGLRLRLWMPGAMLLAVITAATGQVAPRAVYIPAPQLAVPSEIGPAVRILTPIEGETLMADYVHVRYELKQPASSDEPNFLVQLDANDPVNTSQSSITFNDVQPGTHIVRVTLVDANNIPIQGGTATIQFTVKAPSVRGHSTRGMRRDPADSMAEAMAPEVPIPPELLAGGELNLPMAGSPLPILSVIGFGLLMGGAVHTLRSR
jgi:hypothetical protein